MVSPTRMTPFAPTASTVRMTVPRLPGSRTRSSATQTSPSLGLMSLSGTKRWPNTPTTACGLSRRVIAVMTFSDTSSTSPPAARVRAATFSMAGLPRPDLAKISVLIVQPRSSASMTSFRPSAMKAFCWSRNFFSASDLMSLTSGLARLVTSLTRPGAPVRCSLIWPPSVRKAMSKAPVRPISRG